MNFYFLHLSSAYTYVDLLQLLQQPTSRFPVTWLDDLAAAGYAVAAYGKVDTGGYYANNTRTHNWEWNGFHENPKEHWCTLARPAGLDLQIGGRSVIEGELVFEA